ncbi:TolC family protein [Hydrogenophaga sp. BPS33]|nr:TolC family protein [Hydrogenophaga sp. BPS33]
MFSLTVAACGIGMFCTHLAASAQPVPVDLGTLMSEAVTQHPDVRSRKSNARAAGYELEGARWGRYPSLTTELQTQSGGPQTVIKVEQPLWTGGRITSRIGVADAGVGEAEAAVAEIEQNVLGQTAGAFFEILRLESRLDAARASETEHKRLFDIIQRRVQSQVSPATDQTQAAARLNQAITERIQTQRQIEAARLALEQMVGRKVAELAPPPHIGLGNWNEDSLLDAALSFSPERRRLEAQVAVANAQIDLARSQLMPTVVAGYQSRLGNLLPGEDRGRLYVALQLQTGAGLSSMSGVQVAISRKQAALDAIDALERTLTQQVRSIWSERQALGRQVEPVRALLSGADEIVASYLRQFQVGRKNWLDVLNALREKTQAYYALADLESPILYAEVRLLLLAGQLNAQNPIPNHVR